MARNIRQVLDNGTAVLAQYGEDLEYMRPGRVVQHLISQEAWLTVGNGAKPDGLIVRFTDEEGGSAEYGYGYIDPEHWNNSLVRPLISHTIRVYRDDNSMHEEADYVAVVDNRQCYFCTIIVAEIPAWKHAVIQLMHPIECPHPALLDPEYTSWQRVQLGNGQVAEGNLALEGWHYLLNSEDGDIDEVRGQELLA